MTDRKEPAVLTEVRINRPPEVCTKPHCEGIVFLRHEDGWQCLNCMKIIYSSQPILDSDERKSCGFHRYDSKVYKY